MRIWASVTRAALLLAATVATIYLCAPPVITAVLHRPVTELGAEDYAVYSGFVEGFLSSNQPFKADQSISPDSAVYVVGETLPIRNADSILPLDVAVLGPEEMGEDFFRQNARSWLLQPRFHISRRISIVGRDMLHRAAWAGAEELFDRPEKGDERKWLPHTSLRGPLTEAPSVSGVLQLSRVGFNRRKTLALLYYSYRCGVLCGQSGWVVLHKAGGSWQIEKFGRGAVY
jgi:hypothetical protein